MFLSINNHFLYTSNGKQNYFHDFRKKDFGYEEIFVMHKPKRLVEMFGIEDPFAGLPTLNPKGLRTCQYQSITGLEKSFRNGQNRALIVLATGAGKTYTACLASYRMLAYRKYYAIKKQESLVSHIVSTRTFLLHHILKFESANNYHEIYLGIVPYILKQKANSSVCIYQAICFLPLLLYRIFIPQSTHIQPRTTRSVSPQLWHLSRE